MIKRILLLCIPLCMCYATLAQSFFSSLEFSIQKMGDDNLVWGVYVRPLEGFETPTKPVIATGQITVLLRNNGFDNIEHIQSINGNWNGAIEQIHGPTEAPDISYYFIGFIDEGNGIELENEQETLLLTLQLSNCPDTIALINNQADPFALLPNSVSNNPGMDFEVYNVDKREIHNWAKNYETSDYSCGNLTTSVNDAAALGLLSFYPNPVDQQLQLDWSGDQDAQISIMDLSSQVQLSSQTLHSSQQIDVSQFPAGMYFIKIESGQQQFYSKFVKR